MTHTIREEQLLGNEAVTKCTGVDFVVGKRRRGAKIIPGVSSRGIVCDSISDRGVQWGTADLTRTTDGDMRFGDGKHASCECVAERHWSVFSASGRFNGVDKILIRRAHSTSVSFRAVSTAVLFN